MDTRIGTLRFHQGAPDEQTVKLIYDQLDFSRGVDAFLNGISATSVRAACNGLEKTGVKENEAFGITEDLMDARSLFLTPNTTTVYAFTCFDLANGPMVLQVPTGILGPLDDAYFRWVTDIGVTGPDAGKGGQYSVRASRLFRRPPHRRLFRRQAAHQHAAHVLQGVRQGRRYRSGGAACQGRHLKPVIRRKPGSSIFSGAKFNTISANTIRFYDELNEVVQAEPADFFDPDKVGLFAAIGIRKGQPFAPDERMKAILTDAVAVANATARTILFASRDERAKFYPDRQWFTAFIGGSYLFEDGAARLLDARTMFFYYATGITPAMAMAKVGSGSAYAASMRDANGNYLDGGKTYRITLPGPIPAREFWSFVVYDNQTRSILETDQKLAGVDSTDPALKVDPDGSVTVWFGPKGPAGHESNWVQTMPGKGWNVLLRLYGPLEPWFDKSWKPGDIELVR